MNETRDTFTEKNMKVHKVWNIEPQKMLDYILEADRSNGLHKEKLKENE